MINKLNISIKGKGMVNKRKIAKEWLYLLIFFLIGLIALPLFVSLVGSLINPINHLTEAKKTAWWNIYSQTHLEDTQIFVQEKNIQEYIQNWISVAESGEKLQNEPFSVKYKMRIEYFETIQSKIPFSLYRKDRIESAKEAFFKPIMEIDIIWMKTNNLWIEPEDSETHLESKFRWKKMWLSAEPEIIEKKRIKIFFETFARNYPQIYIVLLEGLDDSPLGILLFIFSPYLIFQFVRSILWALRQVKQTND